MADISAHPSSFSGASAPAAVKRGLLRRALDAIMEGQQRKADREIAAILARRGGLFAEQPPGRAEAALPRPAKHPRRA